MCAKSSHASINKLNSKTHILIGQSKLELSYNIGSGDGQRDRQNNYYNSAPQKKLSIKQLFLSPEFPFTYICT